MIVKSEFAKLQSGAERFLRVVNDWTENVLTIKRKRFPRRFQDFPAKTYKSTPVQFKNTKATPHTLNTTLEYSLLLSTWTNSQARSIAFQWRILCSVLLVIFSLNCLSMKPIIYHSRMWTFFLQICAFQLITSNYSELREFPQSFQERVGKEALAIMGMDSMFFCYHKHGKATFRISLPHLHHLRFCSYGFSQAPRSWSITHEMSCINSCCSSLSHLPQPLHPLRPHSSYHSHSLRRNLSCVWRCCLFKYATLFCFPPITFFFFCFFCLF